MTDAAPLSAGERDELHAGCGMLTITNRLDRGVALDPVLAFLARRPRGEGYLALAGAAQLYTTRQALDIGDPVEASRYAARCAVLAARWRRDTAA